MRVCGRNGQCQCRLETVCDVSAPRASHTSQQVQTCAERRAALGGGQEGLETLKVGHHGAERHVGARQADSGQATDEARLKCLNNAGLAKTRKLPTQPSPRGSKLDAAHGARTRAAKQKRARGERREWV